MMRQFLFVVLSAAVVSAEEVPNYGPLAGVYELVGRRPDSKETYSGTVTLISVPAGLRVERRVGDSTLVGEGRIKLKTPDKIEVLEISFKDGTTTYESSCRVGWDLDNYARITCLYGIVGQTNAPGMEAFFIQQ